MPAAGLIVIGGSAGSIEVVAGIVAALPAGFPGAVAVVVHLPEHGQSRLAQVLARRTELPVADAIDQGVLAAGTVHVARPGYHLSFEDHLTRVARGPRENGHRPSIDLCLRSAASVWGARAVGVIVSGALSDGAAGLQEIRRLGGQVLIQDPDEATFAGMPTSALEASVSARALPAAAIPLAIMRLANGWTGGAVMDDGRPADGTIGPGAAEPAADPHEDGPGFGCPACGGSLRKRSDGGWVCRVGHRYSAEALDGAQQEAVEAALWSAYRALQENQDLNRRLERRARDQGASSAASRFRARARAAGRHAGALGGLLGLPDDLGMGAGTRGDDVAATEQPALASE